MGVEAPATSDGAAAASGRSLTHTIIGWAIALLLWVLVLASIAAFATMLKKFDRATREDFSVYYLEGQELRHGVDPYTTNFMSAARAQGLTTHDIGHGSDPPTFVAFLIEPLTLLPIRTAYWIWQAANLLCLAAALALLIGPQVGFSSPFAAAFALLTIFYPPVPSHFLFGQSKLPVLLLLVLTMRLLERKRERLAGLALAMAVLLRFFPLVMTGYLILQRRWRALAYAILGIVVGAILTIAASGLSNCASFFVSASGLVNDSVAGINRDISLYFFVSRNLAAFKPARRPPSRISQTGHCLYDRPCRSGRNYESNARVPSQRRSRLAPLLSMGSNIHFPAAGRMGLRSHPDADSFRADRLSGRPRKSQPPHDRDGDNQLRRPGMVGIRLAVRQ